MKLFNKRTGLYFRLGGGFTERCLFRAHECSPLFTKVVKRFYANVAEVRGRLVWCACDACDAKRKARFAV